MSYYQAEIINLSLKNTNLIDKFFMTNVKKRFLGLVKIYTIKIPEQNLKEIKDELQKNMSTNLHKEWYITIHNDKQAIILFRQRSFILSLQGIHPVSQHEIDTTHAIEKDKWDEMLGYAKSLGIPDDQCDFFPEDYASINYIS